MWIRNISAKIVKIFLGNLVSLVSIMSNNLRCSAMNAQPEFMILFLRVALRNVGKTKP